MEPIGGTPWTGNRSFGALLIGVAVLGYIVWDSRQNTVVKLPGVEIKKN